MKKDLEEIAYILYQALEGDDVVDSAYSILRRLKFTDENSEWIYPDE